MVPFYSMGLNSTEGFLKSKNRIRKELSPTHSLKLLFSSLALMIVWVSFLFFLFLFFLLKFTELTLHV